jgi:hypothetical protein
MKAMKRFGVLVLVGSAFTLMGCGGSLEDSGLDPAGAPSGDEQVGSTTQEVTNGAVNGSCAQSLTLRSSPGGATIGTMYTSWGAGISKFYVQSTSGSWSYGYSYSLGSWGYVMQAYLTTNYSERGTPGQFGYSYSCCSPATGCFGEG